MSKEIKILGAIVIVVVAGAIIGASYYRNSVQSVRVTTNTNSGQPKISVEQLVRPDSPTLGAADAKVTIVEFLDPECESCAKFNPIVKKVLKDYEGKVRLVVRYMPLHPNSMLAAAYTEAAGEQGKYWEMQAMLFERQPEWGTRHGPQTAEQPDAPAAFEKYAKELGLDLEKIKTAFKEDRYSAKLARDKTDGQTVGVRQTPTLFVNGRKLASLYEASLRSLIEEELKQ